MRIALTCSIKPLNVSEEDREKYAEFDSRETIDDLASAIKANGHSVDVVDVRDDIRDVLFGRKGDIDLVFNVAEGLEGEDREALVPGICEELGIPFTGADSRAAVITLNKTKTKEILMKNNIKTPKFQVFSDGDEPLNNLAFPLLVKPANEGSSKGIFNENLSNDKENLKKNLKKIIEKYKQPVIVEEFLSGREFTVAIIGYKEPIVLPIVEIKFDHLPSDIHPMDSYEAKWVYDNPEAKHDPLVCPAEVSDELREKIEEIALKTYKILNQKDWARVDIRLDKNDVPHVLEVNTPPGFMKDPKENSRLPRAAYANGWSYEKLIGEVIKSAVERLVIVPNSLSRAQDI